jgi:hypothetical protein
MKQIASKATTKSIGKVTGFALQYLSYLAIAGIIYLVVSRQYLHFVETFQTAPSIW